MKLLLHFLTICVGLLCTYYAQKIDLTPDDKNIPCIPVMGFGFIDDVKGFVPRLLSSIDFCIDNFIIVISKNTKLHYDSTQYPNIKNMTIHRHPYELLGVSEGWNKILHSFPYSPWYLISAYDVLFLPGQLKAFSHRFWSRSLFNSNKTVNFAHTRWSNMPGGKGFNLFALNQEVIQNCGYFDENIFPAFWEDRDYKIRLKLWSGTKIRTFADIRPIHGSDEDRKLNYTSGTKYLKPAWHAVMKMAASWNIKYVIAKWGCNLENSMKYHDLLNCTYSKPFGVEQSIAVWKKNDDRIHKLRDTYKESLSL
jgi:hypothetical protein